MASLESITVETPEPTAADFYGAALGLGTQVRVRRSEEPSGGFRGFLLGLVLRQPADVDEIIRGAVLAGATSVKPAARSLWGYGGVLAAPDGTIVTVASSSKKDSVAVSTDVEEVVLQLGVADVAASKRFYAERGFAVGKSYGRRYVEFDTRPISFTLNRRADLAKTAGVPADGSGSHRLLIGGDGDPFTDPDGYAWRPPMPPAPSS
ncbi:glyoxalase [Microbacterium sp. NPDC091662]|uniref:glyoxalase n=1 Tax=Microbacterium sp. NPDC091662 TaxID=3364211 RepID=UPI0037F9E541